MSMRKSYWANVFCTTQCRRKVLSPIIAYSSQRFAFDIILDHLLNIILIGATSYDDLQTVDGQVCNTFKEACQLKDLLENDQEWLHCLKEASKMQTGHQLYNLFVIILLYCNPTNPHHLWQETKHHLCDDLEYSHRNYHGINDPTPDQVYDYGLHFIDKDLHKGGKNLDDYAEIPRVMDNWCYTNAMSSGN